MNILFFIPFFIFLIPTKTLSFPESSCQVLFVDFTNRVPKSDINILRYDAKRGHAPSQSELGELYLTGQGVPQNYEYALKLFLESAKQGDPQAPIPFRFYV